MYSLCIYFSLLKKCELFYRKIIQEVFHVDGLVKRLTRQFYSYANIGNDLCEGILNEIVMLYMKMRIHYTVTFYNRTLITFKNRKCQKLINL